MEIWKLIHISCACLSITGFSIRGYWMLSGSPLFQHKLTKILPHMVDSLLLISAIAMLVSWKLNPLDHPWVMAKIAALLVYIGLGMFAFRFGKSKNQKVMAWLAALLTVIYIVQTAITKNPWVI